MIVKLKKYLENNTNISIFGLFLLLTLFFTFPLVFNFNSQIPKGGGDTYQSIANIDLRVQAMRGLDFFSALKYFLSGLGTHSIYVFLNLFFNKYAAYNIVFVLSYVLSGLGAYLLAYHFTQRRGASFVAGLIFAFAPFHYYQTVAVHLGSMQQQWVPFAALFLVKFLDDLKLKNYILFLFALFLVAISEHQLLAFTLLFLAILVIIKIWQNKSLLKNKKLWLYLAVSAIFFTALVFFVFGDLLGVATSDNNFLDPGTGAAKKYAMNAWEPLLPPGFHAFWPEINTWLRKTVGVAADDRDSYFLGFSSMILAGIFIWQYFYKKEIIISEKKERQGIQIWIWSFVGMYVFSWGPGFNIANLDLPLPYYLIYKFAPFYENIRTTGRMFMFVILAMSILLAYAIKYLQPMLQRGFFKKYFIYIFSVVILLEFWIAPLGLISISYSQFYDQIAKDEASYSLLEIPGSTDYEFASYAMITDNIHKKKVVNGMALARNIKNQFDWQRNTPIIKQLLYTLPKGNDPEKKVDNPAEYFKNANVVLNEASIGYITISKLFMPKDDIERSVLFIEKYIRFDSKYEDNYLIAYKISK